MAKQIGIVKRFNFTILDQSLAENLGRLFAQLELEVAPLTLDSHLEVLITVTPGAVLEQEPFTEMINKQLLDTPQLFPGAFIGFHTIDGQPIASFVRTR